MPEVVAGDATMNVMAVNLFSVQVLDLVDDGPSGVDLHHDGDDNEAVPQETSAPSGL